QLHQQKGMISLSPPTICNSAHLFTLQEGVSLAQYREMRESGVRLVVPSSLHKKYPEAVRAELMTLGAFIAELTGLYADIP
ncbi:type II restriction endonuclease, partial [Klebsiella pneumoniae]|uniref:type II restriction endonuclease n=1 Tax=Klebsiella pneumoniae TaxID=573 RepID=UPI00226D32F9